MGTFPEDLSSNNFSSSDLLPDHESRCERGLDHLVHHISSFSIVDADESQLAQAKEHHQKLAVDPQAIIKNVHRQGIGPDSYFTKFVGKGFIRTPTASFSDEFHRLARHMRWGSGSKVFRRQRILATEGEVTRYYGGSCKLVGWQLLCEDIGIEPIPSSISKCRQGLRKVYVNIYDLLDWRRNPLPRAPFKEHKPTLKALKAYTLENEKIFPLRAAKEEGFIRALLRPIIQ